MNEKYIEILKGFRPFIIKAKSQDVAQLPRYIKYIHSKMKLVDGERYFYFRIDARPGNKYISIYADPECGKYPFAGPGMFEVKENISEIGVKIIERFEDAWWLPRNSFDNWFEIVPSE